MTNTALVERANHESFQYPNAYIKHPADGSLELWVPQCAEPIAVFAPGQWEAAFAMPNVCGDWRGNEPTEAQVYAKALKEERAKVAKLEAELEAERDDRVYAQRHPRQIAGAFDVNGYDITTVKLVSNYGTDEAPLWYETMVFKHGDESLSAIWCQRYDTRAAALKWHSVRSLDLCGGWDPEKDLEGEWFKLAMHATD